jgi:hypothetical protein
MFEFSKDVPALKAWYSNLLQPYAIDSIFGFGNTDPLIDPYALRPHHYRKPVPAQNPSLDT